jgi:hypothetical protein
MFLRLVSLIAHRSRLGAQQRVSELAIAKLVVLVRVHRRPTHFECEADERIANADGEAK